MLIQATTGLRMASSFIFVPHSNKVLSLLCLYFAIGVTATTTTTLQLQQGRVVHPLQTDRLRITLSRRTNTKSSIK